MASTRNSGRKPENLKKLQVIELKEILEREQKLLRNRNLISKLPDKGESIKVFLTQVEKELKYRENMDDMEDAFSKVFITEQEKHVRKICDLEKVPVKDRYKPFSTLNKVQVVPANSNIFKLIEDCKAFNNPTKLILLPESMDILKKQDERVKDEQAKIRFNRMFPEAADDDESDNDSDSEQSLGQNLEPEVECS